MPRSFIVFLFPVLFFSACLFFAGCSSNNVTVDNSLQRHFDSAGMKGCFGLFDNEHGHFTIYNLSRFSDSFYQPGATFNILESLIAIQTGAVKDDNAVIDSSLTLRQCFQASGDSRAPGFGVLASHIGRDTIRKWIDSLKYGNQQTGRDSNFWEDNSLKINSDQQLGLLKKMYFNQLPFFQRTQQIVSRMMRSENNSAFRFSYKTAWGKKEDGHAIGWVMGWVEENKSPYFFVVNLETANPDKDLEKTGLTITKGILQQLGLFQGKKY